MSIYSGFATRNQQSTYDQLTLQLIQLLTSKILKSYHQQQVDQLKFAQILKLIFIKLSIMEKQKYLQPNLSNALFQIVQYLLQQEEPQKLQIQTKKNSLWVKIKDQSEQNFTLDTHKNQSLQLSSRKTSANFNIRLNSKITNPENENKSKSKGKNTILEPVLRHKIIDNEQEKQKSNQKRHKSMRNFQQTKFNLNADLEQKQQEQIKCPHCNHQKLPVNKKSSRSRKNQPKNDSISRKQMKSERMNVPDLVKEYLETANRTYMKNYRKRKVKLSSEYSFNYN